MSFSYQFDIKMKKCNWLNCIGVCLCSWVSVPVAVSCLCTKVRGELVTMGRLYRRPHQPLLFKKIIIFFFQKERAFLFLIGENDTKLTLKNFEFSYQNVEKYQKKLILIGVWYVGIFFWSGNPEYGGFWSEFDQYTDRTAYQLYIKLSLQIQISSRTVCLVGSILLRRCLECLKNYFHLWGLQKSLVAPPLGIFSVGPLVKTIFLDSPVTAQ
jgi:hypothetical protein